MLSLVKVAFTCLDEITALPLFTAKVRPHLEYGNVIWSPRYRSDYLEVEKIQERVTKLVPNLRSLPHEERIQSLKLPSLMHRWRRVDLMQCLQNNEWYWQSRTKSFLHPCWVSMGLQWTRRHSQKFQKKRSRLDMRNTQPQITSTRGAHPKSQTAIANAQMTTCWPDAMSTK